MSANLTNSRSQSQKNCHCLQICSLVRCPACELDTCEGELKLVYWLTIGAPCRNNADIRSKANRALFLCEGFRNGSWNYELTGSYTINKSVGAASGGIFYLKHIKDRAMAGVFSFKSRAGQTSDLQPKAINTFHSVAILTNLQENQGLLT